MTTKEQQQAGEIARLERELAEWSPRYEGMKSALQEHCTKLEQRAEAAEQALTALKEKLARVDLDLLDCDEIAAKAREVFASAEPSERDRQIFDLGFHVCLNYGDNHNHYRGEQADRIFAAAMSRLPPASPTPAGEAKIGEKCGQCYICLKNTPGLMPPFDATNDRMIVCPQCGNKRCPKATYHGHLCSGSNLPGQNGSRFQ